MTGSHAEFGTCRGRWQRRMGGGAGRLASRGPLPHCQRNTPNSNTGGLQQHAGVAPGYGCRLQPPAELHASPVPKHMVCSRRAVPQPPLHADRPAPCTATALARCIMLCTTHVDVPVSAAARAYRVLQDRCIGCDCRRPSGCTCMPQRASCRSFHARTRTVTGAAHTPRFSSP